ncbi:sushi, von Willebrand factor type A, EGF and pentraxin domain-containing protein 1-like [Sycon ciliatum]|uniref:sushi, von Willebrand factor type A, EGF and pentraxin domain-containing protein 1-like n=1 Tax=Sycon ciliatum TaxID=27933 RepID=UPI0031F6F2DC
MESRFGPTATVATRATRDARARVYKGFTCSLLLSCFLVSQEGVLTTLDFEDLSDSGSAIFASLQFFFSTGTLDIMSSVTMISLAIVAVLLPTCILTDNLRFVPVKSYHSKCTTPGWDLDPIASNCKDVNECVRYPGICSRRKTNHPYPLYCVNTIPGYYCGLPRASEGFHYSADEIKRDPAGGVFRFQCPDGKVPHCTPGTTCNSKSGAVVPFGWNSVSKQYKISVVPTCRSPVCLRPTDPAYGSYSNGVFSEEESLNTLTLTCNQGYEVVGNPKVTCLKAPSSITSLAGCTKICTKPTVPNGTFRKGSFTAVNNQLVGTCDNGYTPVQQLKATCDVFGGVTVVGKCVKD